MAYHEKPPNRLERLRNALDTAEREAWRYASDSEHRAAIRAAQDRLNQYIAEGRKHIERIRQRDAATA